MTRRSGKDSHREDWLADALRELPRQHASPGFTGSVIRKSRLARTRANQSSSMRPVWLTGPMIAIVGTTFVLAVAVGLMLQMAAKRTPGGPGPVAESGGSTAPILLETGDRAGVEQLRALRMEQERLLAELEALRRSIDERDDLIYLGGDDSVDFVVDLDALARSRFGTARAPGVMPASSDPRSRGR